LSLGERLRRLRRAPESGEGEPDELAQPVVVPVGDLPGLERSLLGQVDEAGRSLKERLERLVAAAARNRGAVRPSAHSLEELVEGQRIENARGAFYRIEDSVHLDSLHGDVSLSRFRALATGSVGILTGEPEMDSFDLAGSVFLDTETTGLAGGTGTAAFLIGIGYVEADRFVVRQYFMRDYHEEPALLAGLAEDLARFESIVTFNGKLFDVPLLETRYRLDRQRFPLEGAPHFDLLHPARRLWKARLESCRLQSLEVALLGLGRKDDIPGSEIPGIYFDFVRRRDARALAKVFRHNRIDIVSLAALALRACEWVETGAAEDPRDVFSLARVLERARLYERSETAYRRTLESDRGALRVAALVRLASRAKRAGDYLAAAELWQEAAAAGDLLAHRELSLHHERRSRDLLAALQAAERGLQLCESLGAPLRATDDFRRRRERLRRRLGATA
jgi:uncharacterized protein